MNLGDLRDDGQSQTTASFARFRQPVEPVEHAFALRGRNTGAIVCDGKQCPFPVGRCADDNSRSLGNQILNLNPSFKELPQ